MRRVDFYGWLVGHITLSYQMTKGEARGPQTPPHSLPSGDISMAKRRETRKGEEGLTAPHGRKCGRHGTRGRSSLGPAHFGCSAGNLALICCSFTHHSLAMQLLCTQLPS